VDIQEFKKANQLSEWAEMVSACRNSGKTVSEWCSENGINEKSYYYRQKKVCDAVPDLRKAAVMPVAHSNSAIHFAEITPGVQKRDSRPGVTVRLGKTEVHIQNGAETATIETVLRVLSGIC